MLVTQGTRRNGHRIREHRQAVSGSIAPLRAAVVQLAVEGGATEDQRDRVALATSEALTNCALHAYRALEPPGPVAVEAWLQNGTLTVIVSDEGEGMLPRITSPGLGMGLSIMARMSDRVEVDHPDGGGVSVRMTFAVGA